MFEKHRNSKQDAPASQVTQDKLSVSPTPATNSGRVAVIGPGIYINGDISGNENLIIEGKVDGKIRLDGNQVDIGPSGKVQADITAKVIKIAGEVRGDLNGTEKVVILRSGNVHGNIIVPRMTLEDGAIFKGSIDMDPGEPAKVKLAQTVKKSAEKVIEKTAEKTTGPAKAVPADKLSSTSGYSLNGR